jgi:cell division protein FtsQ
VRWLTFALLAATALVLVVHAATWAVHRHRFDFRRIVVTGELRHVNRADLRAALAGKLRGNFFTMRLGAARDAVETVPWVQSASVRRVWPDRLVIHVQERRAIGVWDDGRLLSDHGVLFDGNPDEAEADGAILSMSGPAFMAPDVVAALPRLSDTLTRMNMRLAGVDLSERGSWTLTSLAGQTLVLGRDEPTGSVQQRLLALAHVYPNVVAQLGETPRHIDARYDNGFAVTKP